jgi:hypothetical protein
MLIALEDEESILEVTDLLLHLWDSVVRINTAEVQHVVPKDSSVPYVDHGLILMKVFQFVTTAKLEETELEKKNGEQTQAWIPILRNKIIDTFTFVNNPNGKKHGGISEINYFYISFSIHGFICYCWNDVSASLVCPCSNYFHF